MRDIVERLKDSADQHPLDAPMDLFSEAAGEIARLRRALLAIQKMASIEDKGSWSDLSKVDLAQDMDSIERVIDDALTGEAEGLADGGEQGIAVIGDDTLPLPSKK